MDPRYRNLVASMRPTLFLQSAYAATVADHADRSRVWTRSASGVRDVRAPYQLGGMAGDPDVSHYSTPSASAFNATTSASWLTWVYVSPSLMSVIDRDNGSTARSFQFRINASAFVELIIFIGTSAKVLSGLTAIPTLRWSQIGASYDGSTMRVFLNGKQDTSVAQTGSMDASTQEVRLMSYGGGGLNFSGRACNFAYWANRALGSGDFAALYAAGSNARAARVALV